MWAQYNGIIIPNIVGVYETEETGNTFIFACTFILQGKPKEIAAKLKSIHDKLLAHNAKLSYDLGDGRQRDYDPAANTGFLTRTRIKKIGGWGEKQKYMFVCRGNLPSNRIAWEGAPPRYQHGYIKMEANVDISTSEIETIRFTGMYTATPDTAAAAPPGLAGSPSANAFANYDNDTYGAKEQVITYLTNKIDALPDFDLIKEAFYDEDQYKQIDFDLIYKRRNVPNLDWTRYVLIACNLQRRVNQEISSGRALFVESKYNIPGYAPPPQIPGIYAITAKVAVLRSMVSYSSLYAEYKTNIRNFLLTTFKNSIFKGSFNVLNEVPEVDPQESTVTSTFLIMTTSPTRIWSYTVDYSGRFNVGARKRKILDSKNYSKNIFIFGSEKNIGVTIYVENVGGFPAASLYTAPLPKPAFSMKTKKGWWFDDVQFDIGERNHETFADGNSYLVTRERATFYFEYIEASTVARLAQKVQDAKLPRVELTPSK